MPYTSRFTYADELPADAVKVERVRDKVPIELYYSYEQDKFFSRFLDANGNVKRIRENAPNKRGMVYGRDATGHGICIAHEKYRRMYEADRGLAEPAPASETSESDDLLKRIDEMSAELARLRELVEERQKNQVSSE